jgi:hypothetical protein
MSLGGGRGSMKKYRLRPLISDATKGEKAAGITLEGTGNLKDFIIVSYDHEATPPKMVEGARREFRKQFGKVIMLPKDWQICVFEEIEE